MASRNALEVPARDDEELTDVETSKKKAEIRERNDHDSKSEKRRFKRQGYKTKQCSSVMHSVAELLNR